VEFRQIGWQQLDPDEEGRFDLIHCHGVLYHEPHPLLLLQRLRSMCADGAELYFGSMMLGDPALSEYARYVPGSYYGDETWWWVPGRLVMRWLLETAGFAVDREFGEHEGPPGSFPVVNGYFHASPADPLVPPEPWRLAPSA
jgi:Methyltransferase domain